MFFVYILQSESTGAYYVGQTEDLQGRLNKHNKGEVRSTKSGLPWNLVYIENFPTRSQAVARERQIKGRKKRKFIEALISSERSAVR